MTCAAHGRVLGEVSLPACGGGLGRGPQRTHKPLPPWHLPPPRPCPQAGEEKQGEGEARGGRSKGGEKAPHTIILPSSVMASSSVSAASPRIISLWARPEGIIGKQFSFWSTTQSKITGWSTSIISRIAPSRSPGFSQR